MTEKQLQILHSAMQLFSELGYEAVSTARIAKTAGVSEGLIFRHFGSKEGLLTAIIESGAAQIGETMAVYAVQKSASPSGNAVVAHIGSAFAMLRQNASFWRLVQQIRFQEVVQRTAQSTIGAVNAQIMNTLTAHFQQQDNTNALAEALLLFAQIDGITIHYLQDPEHYPLDQIEQLLISKYS
jgi:AcrR family transcriptional regulator